MKDDAAEGIGSFISHGSGSASETAEQALESLVDTLPLDVADDSIEAIGSALGKSHRDELLTSVDPHGLERADDAVRAARQMLDPHLRNIVEQHVGSGQLIKSMEEFEALRHMQAENLTSEQVQAINTIREALGLPVLNGDLVKVVDLNAALAKLSGGDPNLTGFFLTKTDLGSPNTSQEMIDALRLDFDGSPFSGGTSHVVIETKMTVGIQGQTRIPRKGEYLNGDPMEFEIPDPSAGYPNTGNGFISSKDGRLRPEYRMQSVTAMSPDVTVMKFKNPDGTPKVVTNTQTGASGSEWNLVLDSNSPSGHRWDPL